MNEQTKSKKRLAVLVLAVYAVFMTVKWQEAELRVAATTALIAPRLPTAEAAEPAVLTLESWATDTSEASMTTMTSGTIDSVVFASGTFTRIGTKKAP